MAQLYLPEAHDESDLILAGQVAEAVDSGELYVAWTAGHGAATPAVTAELRDPTAAWIDALAVVFAAVREAWAALLSRDRLAPSSPASAGEAVARPKPAAGEAPAS